MAKTVQGDRPATMLDTFTFCDKLVDGEEKPKYLLPQVRNSLSTLPAQAANVKQFSQFSSLCLTSYHVLRLWRYSFLRLCLFLVIVTASVSVVSLTQLSDLRKQVSRHSSNLFIPRNNFCCWTIVVELTTIALLSFYVKSPQVTTRHQ